MKLQKFQRKTGFSAVRNNSVINSSVACLKRMVLELYHRLQRGKDLEPGDTELPSEVQEDDKRNSLRENSKLKYFSHEKNERKFQRHRII